MIGVKMVTNFSIIIPVYNEKDSIGSVLEELKKFIDKHKKYDIEVICVNDYSTDNTHEILKKFNWIKVINHTENKGYGASLKTGIKNAQFDTIVTMDSDGQHNPDDILKLLKYYRSTDSMIIGKRKITETKKSRIIGKFIIASLVKYLFHSNIEDVNSGLRVFSKKNAIKFFHLCSDRFSFSTSITLSYYAYLMEVLFIPISIRERKGGSSSVNVFSGFKTIMKVLQIAMIYKPLKITFPIFLMFVFWDCFH
jgi:glycosyltransferase involved in cell wall biosynthesis